MHDRDCEMGIEDYQAVFRKLDGIVERVDSFKEDPQFTEEFNLRNSRLPDSSWGDPEYLREFATLISYSQNARSDAVSEMIDTGVLEEAFDGFEVRNVAAASPEKIIDTYWEKLTPVRFKRKIYKIVWCATGIETLMYMNTPVNKTMQSVPSRINSNQDIETFWEKIHELRDRMISVKMPFFSRWTSLLHLLSHTGYDCIKPDSAVMRTASEELKIVQPSKTKSGYYPESDKLEVVRTVQRYSVEKKLRPPVLDLYLLIEGGQLWAKRFVKPSFESLKSVREQATV